MYIFLSINQSNKKREPKLSLLLSVKFRIIFAHYGLSNKKRLTRANQHYGRNYYYT